MCKPVIRRIITGFDAKTAIILYRLQSNADPSGRQAVFYLVAIPTESEGYTVLDFFFLFLWPKNKFLFYYTNLNLLP